MSYTTEAARWRALTIRDAGANGKFVYTVKSTNVYCRPTCPARLARRANVGFCKTPAEAQAAGFRACKRCKPDEEIEDDPQGRAVAKACRLIEELLQEDDDDDDGSGAKKGPKLQDLAKRVGLTPRYFHKIFKDRMGVTPNEYAKSKMHGQQQQQQVQQVHVAAAQGQDFSLHDVPDLGAFDFNDLVDFELSDFGLGLDLVADNASPADLSSMSTPAPFGQETDANVLNLAWTDGCGPDPLALGFDDKLGNELEKYSAIGWEEYLPAVTSLGLDPALLDAIAGFGCDFMVDSTVS